jgi:uncharacterized protein YjiS (DUF1127 family)
MAVHTTTYLNFPSTGLPAASAPTPSPHGVWRRVHAWLHARRQRRIDAELAHAVQALDVHTLSDIGLSDEVLARVWAARAVREHQLALLGRGITGGSLPY